MNNRKIIIMAADPKKEIDISLIAKAIAENIKKQEGKNQNDRI